MPIPEALVGRTFEDLSVSFAHAARDNPRGCLLIGLSVDPVASHRAWEADVAEVTGHAVTFPMIGDPDRRVAALYGMLHPNAGDTATVRSVFVIGPDDRVKLTLTYPASRWTSRSPPTALCWRARRRRCAPPAWAA